MANVKSIYEKLEENYYNHVGEHKFKHDALVALGLLEHPKRDTLYSLAYEHGHAHGYSEIYYYMDSLSELLK